MLHWDALIDESALAALLPGEYARFGRPIKDALTMFLSGLSGEIQASLLAEQMTLPPSTSISARLGLLAQRCPVLHKLGQVLARDRRLALELRCQLQKLESLPASVPYDTIQRILNRELGSLQKLGVELISPALAEASVAVVVPYRHTAARHTAARRAESEVGVFKILKPGIEQRLDQELSLLEGVGSYLDLRCEELRIPRLDYRESFQQVRNKLWDEVRLDQEQRHLARARTFFAREPRVQIPELREFCTNRITAMEWVTGGKVTDHNLERPAQKRWLAKLVVRSLIARPLFSRAEQAMFHSDPHAGNLFLTTDHRLAILDWSLVGSLGERERVAIVQLMLAAVTLQPQRMMAVLERLAERQFDRSALESVVQDWLARMRYGQFPGITWLIGLLDDAVQVGGLRLAADLMLFRKTLHTLDGVLAEIGTRSTCADEVLCTEFMREFAMEWPRRWFAPPTSRRFSTRLSNLDLTGAVLGMPGAGTRYWTSQTLDLMHAIRSTSSASSENDCRIGRRSGTPSESPPTASQTHDKESKPCPSNR